MTFLTKSSLKTLLTAFLVVMLTAPGIAVADHSNRYQHDQEPNAQEMVVDAVVVRPIMLAATAIGTITFIVTSPFSLLGGNIGDAAKTLVYEPAKYTFVRPLGSFEQDIDDDKDY